VLQLARYIAILTNGGKNVDVTVIKDIINSDGEKIARNEIDGHSDRRLRRTSSGREEVLFSQENIQAVLEGMRMTTEEAGGTAFSVFRSFGIEVGGKTGASEAGVDPVTGQNITNSLFAGFAPYHEPEIAVVVLVENGGVGYYSGHIVREILEVYFRTKEEIVEDRVAIPYTGRENYKV
jgi:penicillin-binding protein 2